jgi:hypothetical protein
MNEINGMPEPGPAGWDDFGMNDAGTPAKSDTELTQPRSLDVPADFSLYHARRDLTAKRNAERNSVKREQIKLLLEQMESFDKAEPERKASLTKAIEIQLGVIRGEDQCHQKHTC